MYYNTYIMSWYQKTITLNARSRGCYLVTPELVRAIEPELKKYKVGLANVFRKRVSYIPLTIYFT